MPNLLEVIKQAAVESVQAGNPSDFVFGSVISPKPLKIQVNQKLILTEEFLVTTPNVIDHKIDISIDEYTEYDSPGKSHKHRIFGKKTITVHNALKAGDKVIMLSQQGGQRYVILDKIIKEGEKK